jgi:hypothetical protein
VQAQVTLPPDVELVKREPPALKLRITEERRPDEKKSDDKKTDEKKGGRT